MRVQDRLRLHCIDYFGPLVYSRNKGKIEASHLEPKEGKLLTLSSLPHTKRTLDRVRNRAKCGKVEDTSSSI